MESITSTRQSNNSSPAEARQQAPTAPRSADVENFSTQNNSRLPNGLADKAQTQTNQSYVNTPDSNEAQKIFGTSGHDSITTGSGNDYIDAGNGDDSVNGGKGNDVIWGGSGSDNIGGGDGNDSLFGGAGHDRLIGGNGNDYLDAGQSNQADQDVLRGGAGYDQARIHGSSEDYTIGRSQTGYTPGFTFTHNQNGSVITAEEVERFIFDNEQLNATELETFVPEYAEVTPNFPSFPLPTYQGGLR